MTAWLRAAVDEGLLPATATLPSHDNRPWPVVLLTALGAWLAAIPLLGVVGLLLGDLLRSGAGPYAVGALVLAGAVTVLRSRGVPLFVEQQARQAGDKQRVQAERDHAEAVDLGEARRRQQSRRTGQQQQAQAVVGRHRRL